MNTDKNSPADKIVGSTVGLDARHPLKVLAERFRERDNKAVDDFNEYIFYAGESFEARLSFAESRLIDVANMLVTALEKIADMESND
jgi:hypothetical protein